MKALSVVCFCRYQIIKWWYGANSYLYVQTDRQICCRPINQILDQNAFPNAWKEVLVIPIPKSGDSANPSNHRPISLLPILSKVAEKVMYNKLTSILKKHI